MTTELTNQNQQKRCSACLNWMQRAHKSLFVKCFGLLSLQVLIHYYEIHIVKVMSAIQGFRNLRAKKGPEKKTKK